MACYFRCEEPNGQCQHARTRAVLVDQSGVCPLNHPDCAQWRRPVPLLTALRERYPARFWGLAGLVGLVILALLLSLLLGGNRWRADLDRLRTENTVLNGQLKELEAQKPKQVDSGQGWDELQHAAQGLRDDVRKAVTTRATAEVSALQARLADLEQQQQALPGAAVPNPKAARVQAMAKKLAGDYQTLKGRVATAQAAAPPEDEAARQAFRILLVDVDKGMKRAQRLAQPTPPGPPPSPLLVSEIDSALVSVRDGLKKLGEGKPPFPPEQASLTIVTSPMLVQSLVLPLLQARFADATIAEQPGGQGWSVATSDPAMSPGALVSSAGADAYQPLLGGTADLIVTDQPPGEQARAAFAQAFPGADIDSRAYAEVIALDAIVLLGHPSRADDRVTDLRAGVWGAQTAAVSTLRRLVPALSRTNAADPFTAVLDGPIAQAVAFHHQWQPHLPVQLLAYQPSADARVLKPSAFSIATEDYALSYRVRAAWSPHSRPAARDLVTWITSKPGQTAVTATGFVDLDPKIESGANPVILAALGTALGRDVKSAHRYSTNLRFALNQAALDLKTQADLNRLPPSLRATFPNGQVVILGFTDNTGGPKVNCPLSEERAGKIADRLKSFGVQAAGTGLCDRLPLDTNDTDAGRARNRRAEVWVVEPGQ